MSELYRKFLQPVEIIWTTTGDRPRHWQAVRRVDRNGKVNTGKFDQIAVVVPITNDGKVVFISQYRATVGEVLSLKDEVRINESEYQIIEFPAGVRDEMEKDILKIAKQELQQEAGFAAGNWKLINKGPISAGLSFEYVFEYLATGLSRVPKSDGEEERGITVYEVPLDDAIEWLKEKENKRFVIDSRIIPLIYLVKETLRGEESEKKRK